MPVSGGERDLQLPAVPRRAPREQLGYDHPRRLELNPDAFGRGPIPSRGPFDRSPFPSRGPFGRGPLRNAFARRSKVAGRLEVAGRSKRLGVRGWGVRVRRQVGG